MNDVCLSMNKDEPVLLMRGEDKSGAAAAGKQKIASRGMRAWCSKSIVYVIRM
jgi:hypothetical protein